MNKRNPIMKTSTVTETLDGSIYDTKTLEIPPYVISPRAHVTALESEVNNACVFYN